MKAAVYCRVSTEDQEKEGKWGQLKSLEKLLALKVGKEAAYTLVSPLWGINYWGRGAQKLSNRSIDNL